MCRSEDRACARASHAGAECFRIATAHCVRGVIARCILGSHHAPEQRLGDVTLYPHQCSAARRIRQSLDDLGGAILCDAVGLGKTYTALAVARGFTSPLITAPAVLRPMWRRALGDAGLSASFVSIEALSRGAVVSGDHDLIIADEAHHLRNPATRRYAAVARMCAGAPVLLMSATPIHNSHRDLAALIALFRGQRAHALDPDELGRIIVRRVAAPVAPGARVPRVVHAPWRIAEADDTVLERTMTLPPPVPPSDGGVAAALVRLGLARLCVSSSAALVHALRRRMAAARALIATIDAGCHPTRRELAAWVCADDSVQLAFPELLHPSGKADPALRSVLEEHLRAVESLACDVSRDDAGDLHRAEFVRDVMLAHPRERVVVFTGYRGTARVLYRLLAPAGGIALMTSRGGQVAGGTLTRAETLARFAPTANWAIPPARAEQIRVLVTTDLLSEGVNLHDASVVVHMDLPWNMARLEQRIGRVARLGSSHERVTSYGLRPSPRAESMLNAVATVANKARVALRMLGSGTGSWPVAEISEQPAGLPDVPDRDPVQHSGGRSDRPGVVESNERVRLLLEQWLESACGTDAADAVVDPSRPRCMQCPLATTVSVSSVSGAEVGGAIAACILDGQPQLVALDHDMQPEIGPQSIVAALERAGGRDTRATASRVHAAIHAISRWIEHTAAARDAGVYGPAERGAPGSGAVRAAIRRTNEQLATAPFAARGSLAAQASALHQAADAALPLALEQMLYSGTIRPGDIPGHVANTLDRQIAAAQVRYVPRSDLSCHELRIVALILLEPLDDAGPQKRYSVGQWASGKAG